MISAVLREAYGPMLPSQRFPAFILHLNLPGHLVDVNVHPQKKEVRLRQEQTLKELLIKAVQAALQRNPKPVVVPESAFYPSFPFPKGDSHVEEEQWEFKTNLIQNYPSPSFSFTDSIQTRPAQTEESPLPFFTRPNENPKVLLTLRGFSIIDSFSAKLTGLTKEAVGGLCLVDQKAAYARIHYERLLKTKGGVQQLLIPLTLQFSKLEAGMVQTHLEELNQMGFAIREFGEHTFVIDAYPDFLKQEELTTCLNMIVNELMESLETKKLQQMRENKLALAACRASIPTIKRLSIDEAQRLVDQLFQCEMPFQCPFGNATISYWEPEELPNLFKGKK